MKRLVVYDDDDDVEDDVQQFQVKPVAQPIVKVNQDETTSRVQSSGKAKTITIEDQAFKQAFLRAAKTVSDSKSVGKSSGSEKNFVNVGDASKDGPWAPLAAGADEPQDVRRYETKKSAAAESVVESRESIARDAVVIHQPEPAVHMKETPPTSERHGTQSADYQGRSFLDSRRWPPPLHFYSDDDDIEEEAEDSEVSKLMGRRQPKKQARKESKIPSQTTGPPKREYAMHQMGISRLRVSGCLALTASLDGTVVLWDASAPDDISGATSVGLADDRGAMMTYRGHSGNGVKDCAFPSSPASFASCGYDGKVLLWDTETGTVLRKLKAPGAHVAANAVRFKPDDDSYVLVAFGDRKVRHWDIRDPSEEASQTYEFHQASVSSINFCDNSTKIISTGEDRKLIVWDWAMPAPVKIIAEVWLPSMPTTAVHPSSKSFVAVGLDNRIFQFKIKSQTGVVHKSGECSPSGFSVSGFACEPCFSPCGTMLACGDGMGNIYLLKSRAAFSGAGAYSAQKIQGAHMPQTPVSCVQFHHCYEGVLLSAGWDGKLKWWT